MLVRSRIKPSAYFDSVTLMLVQREVRQLPGVAEAGAVMGTQANKELLRDAGLLTPDVELARAEDLILCVRADDEETARTALARAEELLVRRRAPREGERYHPKTLQSAVRMLPGANLALISVPGRFAAGVAKDALDLGLHVMLFSDNVPIEAEVDLKQRARQRGLMVMGPDCGTAILGGVAMGFANGIRRGTIGVVGAAGTGIQEVTSLIHRGGAGISQAIGTGSRDLSSTVGGTAMLHGVAALAADPGTEVIVLISKPPAPAIASGLLAAARTVHKPLVVNFVGASVPEGAGIHAAQTLEDAAKIAIRLISGSPPKWPEFRVLPAQEAGRLAPSQRYIRGLYSGGTLCYEALGLLERFVGPVYSNIPLSPSFALQSSVHSREHTVIDMGSDEFTVGRLHPMIDPELRHQRLLREAADPEVAVILVDVVLGYGVHPDPARDLVPVIRQARESARSEGRWLSIVASVCGTDEDPQNYDAQVNQLVEAGVLVQASNARAVHMAGLIAEGAGNKGQSRAATVIPLPAQSQPLPDASGIGALLGKRPRVINVGLELFAESLQAQHAEVVSVDWAPPAGGRQKLIDLLDKLNA